MSAWPNPDKPGFPLNPERDGWHWLMSLEEKEARPYSWTAGGEDIVGQYQSMWWGTKWSLPDLLAKDGWRYLGPCHTPADLAAARAEGAEAMREAIRTSIRDRVWPPTASAAYVSGFNEGILAALKIVREQPTPAADALASQHLDDAAVDRMAVEMKRKLAKARAKGQNGWDDPSLCSVPFLADMLISHCAKSNTDNMIDLANLAMMLHLRGATTEVADALARRDDGWQPIETAPRDGTPVDLWLSPYTGGQRRIAGMWWVNSAAEETAPGYWRGDLPRDRLVWRGDGGEHSARYTHWRPVPMPPALRARAGGEERQG